MKAVIFDFNRTIFDPETNNLVKDAEAVLQNLSKQGYELFLISRGGTLRKNKIKSVKVAKYFKKILVSKEKNLGDFRKLIKHAKIDVKSSFVVGDQVRKEVLFGNILGLKTIWVRSGKFSDISPRNLREEPAIIVSKLGEILSVISQHS